MHSHQYVTVAILAAAYLTVLSVQSAPADAYTYTGIADTTGGFHDFVSPAINNNGTVVYGAVLDDFSFGIYTRGSGLTTTIYTTPEEDGIWPSINDAGTVVFGLSADSTVSLLSSSDGILTTIVDSNGIFQNFSLHNPRPGTPHGSVTINNAGTVLFSATLDTGEKGIYTSSGGVITTIVDTTEVDEGTQIFSSFNGASFTNDGIVAYHSTLAIAPGHEVIGLRDSTGNELEGGISSTFGSFQDYHNTIPSINAANRVAFVARKDDGSGGVYTNTLAPETESTVIETVPYNNVNWVEINDEGTVAFNMNHGIYTGPDLVANKVIAPGDQLFGSIVTNVHNSRGSLNNSGQIAFSYDLEDGRSGVAVAAPNTITPPPVQHIFIDWDGPLVDVVDSSRPGGASEEVIWKTQEVPGSSGTLSITNDQRITTMALLRETFRKSLGEQALEDTIKIHESGDGSVPDDNTLVVHFSKDPIVIEGKERGGYAYDVSNIGPTADRYNRRLDGNVLVDANAFLALERAPERFLAGIIAHEIGHGLGLRHVEAPGFLELMDYFDSDPNEAASFADIPNGLQIFTDGVSPVVDPLSSGGVPTGYTQNPLYHLRRWVLKDEESGLGAGSWDEEQVVSNYLFTVQSVAGQSLYDLTVLIEVEEGVWMEVSSIDLLLGDGVSEVDLPVPAGIEIAIVASLTAGSDTFDVYVGQQHESSVTSTFSPEDFETPLFTANLFHVDVSQGSVTNIGDFSAVVEQQSVPEPEGLLLFLTGILCIALSRTHPRERKEQARRRPHNYLTLNRPLAPRLQILNLKS